MQSRTENFAVTAPHSFKVPAPRLAMHTISVDIEFEQEEPRARCDRNVPRAAQGEHAHARSQREVELLLGDFALIRPLGTGDVEAVVIAQLARVLHDDANAAGELQVIE